VQFERILRRRLWTVRVRQISEVNMQHAREKYIEHNKTAECF
jgi:hypothetical protein